ncbi:MAG: hypothetical protein BGN87_05695 [Rhizobiales bacterium 65-79]|jgi:DNA-binding IclR family transcriptional regulator|nr:IclR family transcriptional regulator [Hyphomicrobiales bacterium]OJU07004.1 MAG: hypothetical protein BGN87_05695 [Rhizobiales bacterium 65-79]
MSLVLTKALNLIDLVEGGCETLAGLAEESGMSRSTTHRLLATLVKRNYLEYSDRRYQLGYRLFELAERKREKFDFVQRLRPITERYARETSDTIHLAVLDGTNIVLIERIFGERQLQLNSYVGLRNVAITTAVGKALISQLPSERWPEFLATIPARYPKTRDQLAMELRKARQSGVAVDFDECNVGTCGIASTFIARDSLRVACSINGATVYFEDNRLKTLAPTVQNLAAELGTALQ